MRDNFLVNRREHYIPQFILRNFCIEGKDKTYFYSKADKVIQEKYIKDIFMEMNLYDNASESSNDPRQLELDFGKYENEVAQLINNKILNKVEIILSVKEEESLKLFYILLLFRSTNTRDFFNKMKLDSVEFYRQYQPDGNFEAFRKRNLSYLVNCRSLVDVLNHRNIDEPIKIFMLRDLFVVEGTYLVFFERRGDIDFVIGDKYPLRSDGVEFGLPLIFYCPLSPRFMMAIVPHCAKSSPVLAILKDRLIAPTVVKNQLLFRVKKIYISEMI